MNSSAFVLDTSFAVCDFMKMALRVTIDLMFVDKLYTGFIVISICSYLIFWSIRYGRDCLGLLGVQLIGGQRKKVGHILDLYIWPGHIVLPMSILLCPSIRKKAVESSMSHLWTYSSFNS